MTIFRFILLAALLQSGVLLADTAQEIDHLLGFVASSPCKFDRNGTIHTGAEARDHMTMKYTQHRTTFIFIPCRFREWGKAASVP